MTDVDDDLYRGGQESLVAQIPGRAAPADEKRVFAVYARTRRPDGAEPPIATAWLVFSARRERRRSIRQLSRPGKHNRA